MYDLKFVLSPYVCMQAIPNPSPYGFFLDRGPKYVGSQVCTQSLRMYVGYTESLSVRFFCTIKFLCMQVDQNIQNVNILIELCGGFFFLGNLQPVDGASVTTFFWAKRPLSPPPPKMPFFLGNPQPADGALHPFLGQNAPFPPPPKNLPQQRSPYPLVCTKL